VQFKTQNKRIKMRPKQKEIRDQNVQNNKRQKMKRKKKVREQVNATSQCPHAHVSCLLYKTYFR